MPAARRVLEAAIAAALGPGHALDDAAPASGGCIHESFVVRTRGAKLFVKTNRAAHADAFAAEADGLAALAAAGARAPRCLATGAAGGDAFLALEYLEIGKRGDSDWPALGRMLAGLHRATGARYGWHRDNYIGSTLQHNRERGDWTEFWRDARLLPQLELAARNGLGSRLVDAGRKLAESLPQLLGNHAPRPSLLHGDLWSGNASFLQDGTPVLFDPAVYRGDREADLAMTELFGGFPRAFYAAYAQDWPLAPGYPVRRDLYNLYHVLNHANLFGGGYAAQAQSMIGRLSSEV